MKASLIAFILRHAIFNFQRNILRPFPLNKRVRYLSISRRCVWSMRLEKDFEGANAANRYPTSNSDSIGREKNGWWIRSNSHQQGEIKTRSTWAKIQRETDRARERLEEGGIEEELRIGKKIFQKRLFRKIISWYLKINQFDFVLITFYCSFVLWHWARDTLLFVISFLFKLLTKFKIKFELLWKHF